MQRTLVVALCVTGSLRVNARSCPITTRSNSSPLSSQHSSRSSLYCAAENSLWHGVLLLHVDMNSHQLSTSLSSPPPGHQTHQFRPQLLQVLLHHYAPGQKPGSRLLQRQTGGGHQSHLQEDQPQGCSHQALLQLLLKCMHYSNRGLFTTFLPWTCRCSSINSPPL